MFQEFYNGSNLLNWPLLGLVIFFLSFCGVLVYVFAVLRTSKSLDHVAELPLTEDTAGSCLEGDADDE